MQAATSQITPAPRTARRRWLIAPAAAVLVAVLGVVIFTTFAHHPASSATTAPTVTTITPAVNVVPAKDFQRFPTGNDEVNAIVPTNAPDGALWFTDQRSTSPTAFHLAIARWTPDGKIHAFDIPDTDVQVVNKSSDDRLELIENIITGPDDNLWFIHTYDFPNSPTLRSDIGRMTPTGQFTFFALPPFAGNTLASRADSITIGPDGNLWITANYIAQGTHLAARVGRITLAGQVTWFNVAPANTSLSSITLGPDHHLWLAANALTTGGPPPNGDMIPAKPNTWIGRMALDGTVTYRVVSYFTVDLRFAPDGRLWFTALADKAAYLGRFDIAANHITYFAMPDLVHTTPFVFGPDGSVWIITANDKDYVIVRHLYRLSPQGELTRVQLPGDNVPAFVAFAADGQMWLTDFTYHGPNFRPANFTSYIARITP